MGYIYLDDAYGITALEFSRRLSETIKEEKTARRVLSLLEQYTNNTLNDEDIVEARGFYLGLRCAKEMFQEVCCEYYTEYLEKKEQDGAEFPEDFDNEEVMDTCPDKCPFIVLCHTDECDFHIITDTEEE